MKWHEDFKELARRRRAAGLSQAELSKRTGRSRSLIRDVESGRIKLRGELAEALWQAIADADIEKAEREKRLGSISTLADLRHADPAKVPASWRFRDTTRERAMERLIAAQSELIYELRKDHSEKNARIAELEARIELLSDLLNVETEKGLGEAKAQGLAAEAQDIRAALSRDKEEK
jgi:transcriptional regulator with XRE-family HTH domain